MFSNRSHITSTLGQAVWVCLLLSLAAPLGEAAESDAEWFSIQGLIVTTQTKNTDRDPYSSFVEGARRRDRLHALLLEFVRRHPEDIRSREATFQLLMRPPVFLIEVEKERFDRDGELAARYDTEAVERWRREAQELEELFLNAPTTLPEWKRDLLRRDIYIEARDLGLRHEKGESVDLASLKRRLDQWLEAYGASDRVAVPVESYMRVLTLVEPSAAEDAWRRFARSSNPILQELADGQLLVIQSRTHPLDWKFTALDGREVDFAKLRGKVVLVDFWATWCGPCVAELPKLKKLYSDYHDRGFEIVGIALDSAADRGRLENFVRSRGVAWPQHFDGGGRRNAYAVRYGIKSVPTKMLVDATGRVVQPRARIEDLSSALDRLLGR